MREAVLLSLILVWLGVACVTQVDVVVDESTDFSQLRTWAWLPPGASPEMGVDAPHRDAAALHAHLGRLVERELWAQGFERADRPDFFVIYQLVLKPRRVTVEVPRAPYLLLSMSSAPSYWIEGSDEQLRVYEDFRLAIGLLAESGRVLWRGVMRRKVEEGKGLSLDAAVADLLERLRSPGSGHEDDRQRRESDAPEEALGDPPRVSQAPFSPFAPDPLYGYRSRPS